MTHRLVWLPLALVCLSACAPWRVIRESEPSALAGATHVVVAFDYSRASLGGRSEQAWLATQPPDDVAAYNEVKREMEQAFMESFASRAGLPVQRAPTSQAAPGTVLLTVAVMMIEQGKYAVVFAMDSELDAHLEWQPIGAPAPTDIIEIHTRVEASMFRPSIIQRMRVAADRLGELAAQFLREKR